MKTTIMKKIITLLTLLIISCGISEHEHKKVLEENKNLIEKLDDCKNGAEKLIARVENAYKEKEYASAIKNIELLSKKHPESPKNKDFKFLLVKIEKEKTEIKKQLEEKEKEKIRIANLNNTGIWNVKYYVDEFGESTKDGYISCIDDLDGLFSNSATQNSELKVRFLITSSTDVNFKLYEYADNNPVKAYSANEYRIFIQDKDGKRHKLIATNYHDRLSFGTSHSKIVHNVLKKGGTVKFSLYEIDTPTSEYKFTIQNADYYDNAYRILKSKK